jgi:CPA1 family monovalent cation:H+ antiporter
MEQFISTETLIIVILLVVSLVATLVRRLRIPYIVALVLVGLLLTIRSPFKIELTPELILSLFVPPLVFEAAFHLNFNELRRNLPTILAFAIPGVIITTFIVGGLMMVTMHLSLQLALLFGSLIAATDPLAVIATFRKLGVPGRLTVIVEGESLLNDGTAIVIFNLMLAVVLTGKFDLASSLIDFIRVAVGGTVIGFILGWIVSALIERIDDYLIEMTLTTVLAFGSYLLAEQLHLSGVLAVLAAGLINGNLSSRGMSPTTRIVLSNFWEYIAFLANSVVFLLIGMQINIQNLASFWINILIAILVVFIARVIVIYSFSWLVNRFTIESIPFKWQHILAWSGLRGAIGLALALSLPASMSSDREILRVMVFGVVLFTLLVQSTTMRSLIRRLKIVTRSEAQVEYERSHARLTSLRMADNRLDRLHTEGLLSPHAWETLKEFVTRQADGLMRSVRGLILADPVLEAEELDKGWRELFRSQRNALFVLRRDGVISDEVYEELTAEIDGQLLEGYPSLHDNGKTQTRFMDVTIPDDAGSVDKTVAELGLPRTAILVSIRRGGAMYIPHGDTQVMPGDIVTILCEREHLDEIKNILLSPPSSET